MAEHARWNSVITPVADETHDAVALLGTHPMKACYAIAAVKVQLLAGGDPWSIG